MLFRLTIKENNSIFLPSIIRHRLNISNKLTIYLRTVVTQTIHLSRKVQFVDESFTFDVKEDTLYFTNSFLESFSIKIGDDILLDIIEKDKKQIVYLYFCLSIRKIDMFSRVQIPSYYLEEKNFELKDLKYKIDDNKLILKVTDEDTFKSLTEIWEKVNLIKLPREFIEKCELREGQKIFIHDDKECFTLTFNDTTLHENLKTLTTRVNFDFSKLDNIKKLLDCRDNINIKDAEIQNEIKKLAKEYDVIPNEIINIVKFFFHL